MEVYGNVAKEVAPKREKLRVAQKDLAKKRQDLSSAQEQLAEVLGKVQVTHTTSRHIIRPHSLMV